MMWLNKYVKPLPWHFNNGFFLKKNLEENNDLAGHIGTNEANLTSTTVGNIHDADLKVVSIACFKAATDTTQWTYDQGFSDGTTAAAYADNYGLATDVIYWDIEGTTTANSSLVSYLGGVHYALANTIVGLAFHLGVYTNPYNAHYLQGSSVASEVAMWWIAAYNNSGPWYDQSFTGSSNLWQYSSDGFTYNGVQYNADLDEITNTAGYGGW